VRRLIIFAIVALLGFAPLVVRSVSAQGGEGNAWQGVTVGEPTSRAAESSAEPFQLLADFLGDPRESRGADPRALVLVSPRYFPSILRTLRTLTSPLSPKFRVPSSW
jgi:hypothetical protein